MLAELPVSLMGYSRLFIRIGATFRITRLTKFAARDRKGRRPTSNRRVRGTNWPLESKHVGNAEVLESPSSRSEADAFYAAPGSTIKVGGGLGTPDVTE